MPNLHEKALCHSVRMSLKGPLGTHVPSATLSWWGSLAPLLGMPAVAQLWAMTDAGSVPAPSAPSMSGTSVPQPCGKWWCSSDQGMPDLRQEEDTPSLSAKEPPERSRNLWLGPSGRPDKRPSLRTLRW